LACLLNCLMALDIILLCALLWGKNGQWSARVIALSASKAHVLALVCSSSISQRSPVTVGSFDQS